MSNLIPPSYAHWGIFQQSADVAKEVKNTDGTGVNGWKCKQDLLAYNSQVFYTSVNNTFYVYWINGVAQPYYFIIGVHDCFFNPCQNPPVQANQHIRGYAMVGAWFSCSVQTATGGWMATKYSPATSEGPTVSAGVANITKLLYKASAFNSEDGTVHPFQPNASSNISLPEWGVKNKSDFRNAHWWFYGTFPWNNSISALDKDLEDLNSQIYSNSNEEINPFPVLSLSGLSATLYTVWQSGPMAQKLGADPVACSVKFNVNAYPRLASFSTKNYSGTGDISQKIWSPNKINFPDSTFDIDCLSVVNQNNPG